MNKRVAPREETLIRVSQAILKFKKPEDLFDALASELRRVVEFNGLLILRWGSDGKTIEKILFRAFDMPPLPDPPAPFHEGSIPFRIYHNQEPILISDAELESQFAEEREYMQNIGIRSLAAFPLTTALQKLGMLVFGSKPSHTYKENDIPFLQLVASSVAVAIDDAVHFEALQRSEEISRKEHERLKLLLEFTNSVASNLKLQELLKTTSSSVRRVMKCDAIWVNLPDAEGMNMHVISQEFPDEKGHFDKELVPIEGSINESVFRKGEVLVVHQMDDIRKYPEEYRRAIAEDLKSACLLPLVGRNRVVGVLSLARRSEDRFQDEEVSFLVQVANQLAIAVENALAYEEIAALKERLALEKLYLEDEIRNEIGFQEIIGQSPSLLHVLQQIETVAPTDSNVLILGETGTGKELIARAIHDHSRRKDRTFVKLNCAAIPTGLLESELFGHEKGAFTGAIAQRIGRLELADLGTLFLDEVGDIPLELQSKLLRALQEREFERLGSSKTRKVDVRLIAATNRDLQKMVAENQFRSDLYYRLHVFPVRVPALRERPEDIPLLVRHFTHKHAMRMEKKIENIPVSVLKQLSAWHWPGNVRELENFIERSVILTQGSVLNVPLGELKGSPVSAETGSVGSAERNELIRALKESRGRVSGPNGAAARLGVKRTTLIARIKKHGIDPRQFS